MKIIRNLAVGCFGLLVILVAVAVILWRGGTGFVFLDSALNAQKRAIIAGQCIERAKLPQAKCDCMAAELATLPVSDVMAAIQSAQSGNPENMTRDIKKKNFPVHAVMKDCGSVGHNSQSER